MIAHPVVALPRCRAGRGAGFSDTFLERVYPLPRPFQTIEEWHRLHHQDLPVLSDGALAIELSCCWRRITMQRPPADHWLVARRAALFAERDRRRHGQGNGRRPS